MFIKVRRTFTTVSILFLLGLFILPSLYLKDHCGALNELSAQVLSAARAGDEAAVRKSYDDLRDRYERMRRKAELFLDHRVMDSATLPLSLMEVYLRAGDMVSLEAAVVQFQEALACILAIETGDIRLLL